MFYNNCIKTGIAPVTDWEVNMWMWGNPRTCFLLDQDKQQLDPCDRAQRPGLLPSGNNGGTRNYQTIIPPALLASLRGPQASKLPVVLIVLISRRQEKQTSGQDHNHNGIFHLRNNRPHNWLTRVYLPQKLCTLDQVLDHKLYLAFATVLAKSRCH